MVKINLCKGHKANMALIKKGNIWHIDLYANGKRLRRSSRTKSKREAQRLHDELKSEIWQSQELGITNYTWQQAVVRYISETQHKADHEKDKRKLIWIDGFIGRSLLAEIDSDDIRQIMQAKLKEGCTESTANRYLALIRAILRKAEREWAWIDSTPSVKPYPEKQKRIRWLTQEEAANLINDASNSLRPIIVFALSTGLRESNIRLLEWSQVDVVKRIAWIHPDQAKASKPIRVPLNDDALNVIRQQIGEHETLAFGVRDVTSNIKEWRDLSKMYSLRFHDLRHTWASWHVQNGTPLHVLKELGGWATLSMVQRYAHLAPEHLVEYVSNSSLKNVTKTCPISSHATSYDRL